MKKIIIMLIITFISVPYTYAQYGDFYDGRNSYTYDELNRSKKKKKSSSGRHSGNPSHFISLAPSLYIPTGQSAYIKEYTEIGGGVDLNYKYNFHKLFGLGGRFRYNYASGGKPLEEYDGKIEKRGTKSTEHHLMNIQVLALLQYDDVSATKGFIPYLGAGMDISITLVDTHEKISDYVNYQELSKTEMKRREKGANIGFVVTAGVRYAFQNNVTIGLGVDYTHVFPIYDYSGVRVSFEAGYRF